MSEVNGAVSDIEQMTQHNAAMVEESSAAARSLFSEAEALVELVGRFNKDKSVAVKPAHAPQADPVRYARAA